MSKRSIILCGLVLLLFIATIASVVIDFKPKDEPEQESEPEPEPEPEPDPGPEKVNEPGNDGE